VRQRSRASRSAAPDRPKHLNTKPAKPPQVKRLERCGAPRTVVAGLRAAIRTSSAHLTACADPVHARHAPGRGSTMSRPGYSKQPARSRARFFRSQIEGICLAGRWRRTSYNFGKEHDWILRSQCVLSEE